MLVFIGYDIADRRRRSRVVRLLEGYGHRLHESGFICRLRPAQFSSLHARLLEALHATQDRVRLYRLCQRDLPDRVQVAGSEPLDPPEHHVV